MGKELGKCLPKILLVLYELLDCAFPIHFEEQLVGGSMGAGVSETREPKSVTAGIQQRGWWYVVGFCRDKGELEIQVVKDSVMDGGEVLEFELGVSGAKPFEEGDFIVMQERSLKDVGDPLMLLCVCRWVVDVTRSGRLTYVCDVCITIWVLAPPRCSAKLSIGPILCHTCDMRHPGTICGVATASGWRLLVYLRTDMGTTE